MAFGPPAVPAWVTVSPVEARVDARVVLDAFGASSPDGETFPVVFTIRLAPGPHRLTVAWTQRTADPPLRDNACRASASIDVTAGRGTPLPLQVHVEGAPELTRDFGPRPAGVTRVAIWAGRPESGVGLANDSLDDLTVDCRTAAAGPLKVTVTSGRRSWWVRVPKMCVTSFTEQTITRSSCPSAVACDFRVMVQAWGEGVLLSIGRSRVVKGRRASYTVKIEEGGVSTRRFHLAVVWPRAGAPIVTALRELTAAPRPLPRASAAPPQVRAARAVTLPVCGNGEAPATVNWLTLAANYSNDYVPLPDVVTAGRPTLIHFFVGVSPNDDFTHQYDEESVFVNGRPLSGGIVMPIAGPMNLRAVWVARPDDRAPPTAQPCVASVERTITAVEGAPLAFTPAVVRSSHSSTKDQITFTAPAGPCSSVVARPFVAILRALGTEVRVWRRMPCGWTVGAPILTFNPDADARLLTDIPGIASIHLGDRELEVALQERPFGVGRGRIPMELEIQQGDSAQRWAWTSIAAPKRTNLRVRVVDLRSLS